MSGQCESMPISLKKYTVIICKIDSLNAGVVFAINYTGCDQFGFTGEGSSNSGNMHRHEECVSNV